MNLVSIKKVCKIYGISKEEVRESIQSDSFYCVEKKGEVKIDFDSFKQSEYHIIFTYDKLVKIYNKSKDESHQLNDIHSYMSNEVDDEIFETYFIMYEEKETIHIQNIISNLEKESFSKSDYDDYLKSLRNRYKDNLNFEGGETDRISMNILKLLVPLISDELIEKYPSYYDENYLLKIIEDIEKHKYLNNKEMEIINLYVQLLKYGTNKGLQPIIEKIDFDKYEEILSLFKSESKFYKKRFSDGDDKFFSNIRDMFIF